MQIDPRHRYGRNLNFYYDEWCKGDARQPFFYWYAHFSQYFFPFPGKFLMVDSLIFLLKRHIRMSPNVCIWLKCMQMNRNESVHKSRKKRCQKDLQKYGKGSLRSFIHVLCRLDIGEGKEVDLRVCPRSRLRQECIIYLGPVCFSIESNLEWMLTIKEWSPFTAILFSFSMSIKMNLLLSEFYLDTMIEII